MTDMVERWRLEAEQATSAKLRLERADIVRIITSLHLASGAMVIQIKALLGVHDQFTEDPELRPGAVGGSAPARPAPGDDGRGPGTPTIVAAEFGDQPPAWMDPHHDLTQYGPLGERIDYPQMCSGTYSYAALKTWGNR